MPYYRRGPELVFEVVQESDGGYRAECLTESIFTEADTWDELRKNVIEATAAFFFDRPRHVRARTNTSQKIARFRLTPSSQRNGGITPALP
jgi:hypothetical protein